MLGGINRWLRFISVLSDYHSYIMKKRAAPGSSKLEIPYPNTAWLALIALLICVCIVWPPGNEPVLDLITHRWFQYSIGVTLTISLSLVWMINLSNVLLDLKYRWEERFYKRLFLQLILGWSVPVAFSFLLTWLYLQYRQVDTDSIRHTQYMSRTIMILALLLNVFYLAYYYISLFKYWLNIAEAEKSGTIYTDYLLIPIGKEEIKVQLNDIAYLYRKEKEVLLRTHDGKGYVFWQSLEELEKKLDPDHFCRANRSYIITRKAFKRLQRQPDRGILLELEPQTERPVKISRDKTSLVTSWLKHNRS